MVIQIARITPISAVLVRHREPGLNALVCPVCARLTVGLNPPFMAGQQHFVQLLERQFCRRAFATLLASSAR